MALSPWPVDGVDRDAAILRIAEAVFQDTGSGGIARAARWGPVSAEIIERFAPLAPGTIKDEAVFRVCGWLGDSLARKTIKAANLDLSSHRHREEIGALKHSGAGSLLSPWKVRRMGHVS